MSGANDDESNQSEVYQSYNVDELNHCQSEIDFDGFAEVADWSDERIVALALEQGPHQSYFVITAQTFRYQQTRKLKSLSFRITQ